MAIFLVKWFEINAQANIQNKNKKMEIYQTVCVCVIGCGCFLWYDKNVCIINLDDIGTVHILRNTQGRRLHLQLFYSILYIPSLTGGGERG